MSFRRMNQDDTGYAAVASEVARRLREADARGDESNLRESGALTIEQLLEQNKAQARLIRKYRELVDQMRDDIDRRFPR